MAVEYDKQQEEINLIPLFDEFERLYNADSEFKYMNLQSVKIMLRLNLRYRIIALHQFGLSININDLI